MRQTHVHNAVTGETIVRDMTDEENAEIEASITAVAEAAVKALEKEKREAYAAESDPLFFKWQRGEGTEEAWLDKVAEIQARYP